MQYAKIDDAGLTYSKQGEFGIMAFGQVPDSVYRSHGYLPLKGKPEQRDGYKAVPSEWHVESVSLKRKGLKQQLQDVLDKDGRKIGEREVMVECESTIDNSYIKVDKWDYVEIQTEPARKPLDDSDFKKACKRFRKVCAQIGEFMDEDDFRGGYEDYDRFINSSAAKKSTAKASLLASMWNGANEYAKYEGSKIKLKSPDWWRRCWEYTDEELGTGEQE